MTDDERDIEWLENGGAMRISPEGFERCWAWIKHSILSIEEELNGPDPVAPPDPGLLAHLRHTEVMLHTLAVAVWTCEHHGDSPTIDEMAHSLATASDDCGCE